MIFFIFAGRGKWKREREKHTETEILEAFDENESNRVESIACFHNTIERTTYTKKIYTTNVIVFVKIA